MRALSRSNKRALSPLIAYVLLIAISISLASTVFVWLKVYAEGPKISECPEGVNLIINHYNCFDENTTSPTNLNITIKNKGRRTVDGYILRVNDNPKTSIGVHKIAEVSKTLKPGETDNTKYIFSNPLPGLKTINFIDIQPFINDAKGGRIYCQDYSSQKITCKNIP